MIYIIISTTYNIENEHLILRNNFESKALFSIDEVKEEMVNLGYTEDVIEFINPLSWKTNGKIYEGMMSGLKNVAIHSRVIEFK